MFKLLSLPLLALSLSATPFFPDFTRDGQSIQGSPLIGRSIVDPGRYLFALEDLRVTNLTPSDFDYNDLFGEITVYDSTFSFYSIEVKGGLGAYYRAGTAGFAGARIIDGIFTLVFNTPTGEMFSGTNQVLLYKLADVPRNEVPELSTTNTVSLGLVMILGVCLLRRSPR